MSQYTFVTTEPFIQYAAPANNGPVYVQQGPIASGMDAAYAVARNSNGTVSLGRVIQTTNNPQILSTTVAPDQWGRPAPQRLQDAPRAVSLAGYSSQPILVQQGRVQYIKATPAVAASAAMNAVSQVKGTPYRSNIVSAQPVVANPTIVGAVPAGTTQQLVQVPQLPEGYYLVKSSGAGQQPQPQTYQVVQPAPRTSTVAAAAAAALASTNVAAPRPQYNSTAPTTLLPAEYIRVEGQPGVQYIRTAAPTVIRTTAPRQGSVAMPASQQMATHQLASAPRPVQQMQLQQQPRMQQQVTQLQPVQQVRLAPQALQLQQLKHMSSQAQQQPQQRATMLMQQQPPTAAMPRATAITTLKAQIAIDPNGNRVVLPGDTLPPGYTLASETIIGHRQPATNAFLQRMDNAAAANPAISAVTALNALTAASASRDNQSIAFDPVNASKLGVIGDGKRSSRPQSEGGSPRSNASHDACGPHTMRTSAPASPDHGTTGSSSPASDIQHGSWLLAPPGTASADAPPADARRMDQHALLCNLGQRFAQLNLSVEQAISSGLVSGLSAQQFKVFAEAHAVEQHSMTQQQASSSYSSSTDGIMMLNDSSSAQPAAGSSPDGQFNAFSYGFFSDAPAAPAGGNELLGALEDEGAALEGAEGAAAAGTDGAACWGSGPASLDGQGAAGTDAVNDYDAMDAKLEQLYLGTSFF